jgi:serine/threonine protein kinase
MNADQQDRYEILEELGRGGTAEVHRAYDHVLERSIAIKVLSGPLANDPAFLSRFEREARVAARLDHPNVVAIHDFGRLADGRLFLAMRLLEGTPLDRLLAEDRLPHEQVAAIVSQVAAALDYTHERGTVHRDIKPSNVIIDPSGRATLTDFGIAQALDSVRVTMTGYAVGTPRYMSPEQVRGEEVSAVADIYSLGVMTYEMLAGRGPFDDDTGLMYRIVNESPPSIATFEPGLPAAVGTALERALAKDPGARWSSAGVFARALARALDGRGETESAPEATLVMGADPAADAVTKTQPLLAPTEVISGASTPSTAQSASGVAPSISLSARELPVGAEEAEQRLGVTVRNLSESAERVSVEVSGLPEGWGNLSASDLDLEAGASKEVTLRVRPRAGRRLPAGRYPFIVRASLVDDPDASEDVAADLVMEERTAFDARIAPLQAQGCRETFKVTLRNTGSVPLSLWLEGSDPAGMCRFEHPPRRRWSPVRTRWCACASVLAGAVWWGLPGRSTSRCGSCRRARARRPRRASRQGWSISRTSRSEPSSGRCSAPWV